MTQSTYLQKVQILVPSNMPWQPDLAEQFIYRLFAIPSSSTLRIESQNGRLEWSIHIPKEQAQTLVQTIYSIYPEASVEISSVEPAIGYQRYQFHGSAPFVEPHAFIGDFNRQIDPVSMLLSSLAYEHHNAHYIFECRLSPVSQETINTGHRMLKKSNLNWANFLTIDGATRSTLAKVTGADKTDRYDGPKQRLLESKLASPLRTADLAFKIRDTIPGIEKFLSLLNPALAAFSRPGCNSFIPSSSTGSYPLVMSPPEIASFWHLPNKACAQPYISWADGAAKPAPFSSSPDTEVIFGLNNFRGQSSPVGTGYGDRSTHTNLAGKTGMGKTTLLHQMIHQDIEHGKGVGIIDPHGDLVDDILRSSIPSNRTNDVVLFSLRDYEYPIGLNILTAPESIAPETSASHVLSILRKLFKDQWSSTRMEDALYAAIVALQSVPNSTIQEVPKLFVDGQFRHQVLASVTDPVALEYWWDEFERHSQNQQQQIAQPINNRIRKLYRDQTMRRIVCQNSCLDFRDILDNGKIFLADLGGAAELNAEVLGALIISKFQLAAMSRADVNLKDRQPFYLFIDEVQNFVTTSLDKILSEARKFGLCLTMGNQFLHQLAGKTLEAVQGNMGTTIIFRVGHKDARALAPFTKPEFVEQDLVDLNKYNVVIKMQRDGQTLPAFSLQTLPPPQPYEDAENRAESIRNLSRLQYGRSRAKVDSDLSKRYRSLNDNQENSKKGNYYD